MIIRDAKLQDFSDITTIYAHHVRQGLASFEEEPPTIEEMVERWSRVRAGGLPFIVAENADRIVGYSYVTPYRTRPAYRFTVEDSIYVADGFTKQGVGSALLAELIEQCERSRRFRQVIAVIGDSGNTASIELHRKFGFSHAGTLRDVGFKLGRWVDSVLMQRELNFVLEEHQHA